MCLECLEAKVAGYPYLEWGACVAFAKDNAAFRAAFLECVRFRREGGRRSWNEAEVATNREHSVRIERYYLAFTRKEFSEHYGVDPTTLGSLVPKTTVPEDGVSQDYWLVKDESQPPRRLVAAFTQSQEHREYLLAPGQGPG